MSSSVYVICSDDPLLKMDRTTELIKQGREQLPDADFLLYTYSDFQSTGDPNFRALETEMADPGLFGGNRIIKINLKDLDNTAVELFKVIVANMRPGLFIVVDMPRITTSYQKVPALDAAPLRRHLSFLPGSTGEAVVNQGASATKKDKKERKGSIESRKKDAFGYLKGINASIEILYTPEGDALTAWVENRARRYSLQIPDQRLLKDIIRAFDNNLLAIDHTFKLLEFVAPNGIITEQIFNDYMEQQDARYTGFELPQAIFSNDCQRALNIIYTLCNGQDSNKTAALSLLISKMDEALSVVYEGKATGISNKKSARDAYQFFVSKNIRVLSTQNSMFEAIKNFPPLMLDIMSMNLASASKAYSEFQHEEAYRALQRMVIAMCTPDVKRLHNLKY